MTEISIHELYRFYLDTIAHCSSAILDKSDDEIAYDLFEGSMSEHILSCTTIR